MHIQEGKKSKKMVKFSGVNNEYDSDESSDDDAPLTSTLPSGKWTAEVMHDRRKDVVNIIRARAYQALTKVETVAKKLNLINVTHVWSDEYEGTVH